MLLYYCNDSSNMTIRQNILKIISQKITDVDWRFCRFIFRILHDGYTCRNWTKSSTTIHVPEAISRKGLHSFLDTWRLTQLHVWRRKSQEFADSVTKKHRRSSIEERSATAWRQERRPLARTTSPRMKYHRVRLHGETPVSETGNSAISLA